MEPKILRSELTGRYYVVTRYKDEGNGNFIAHTKYDVTVQIESIIREANARKKNDSGS